MITRKKVAIITFCLLVSLALIGALLLKSGVFNSNETQETRYLHASWIYNYRDIEEMTNSSDVIALVRISSISKEYMSQGTPFTEYNAEVITPVLSTSKGNTLIIRVTGGTEENVIYELQDAPLLEIGDEMLIFCKQNVSTEYQSYTILSGAQGRLYYSNQKLNSLCMINEDVLQANGATNTKIKDADLEDTINQIRSYFENN